VGENSSSDNVKFPQPSFPSLLKAGSGEATVGPALVSNGSPGMQELAGSGRGITSPIRRKGREAEHIKKAAYTRIRKALEDLKG